ncbi:phage late control D family protein [Gilliamella sp. Pra-s65]|uniref:phage late control D family protein n=1 Tax=unclassified Gilliamella TaxID=2685620 RepID=UPI001365D885|nr:MULTISPECIES: phage late control D family protein [unclassified Gilliamella]MWN89853.1 phage late control D family protein [Gilliamella sp. Pra-s65]MWP73025.1 phage late control D family protein [Gilliamella sp. Pra-s52]
MKQPTYTITIDNKDITSNFDKRLISMQITDNRGLDADTISIELDDSDGKLELPKRGVQISVSLGWVNDNVILQNIFTIDECEHSGTPDVLSIRGKSANLRDSLNEKREKSYSDTTLGSITKEIAKRHNLLYKIDKSIEHEHIAHIDQTNESDASFLTRLYNDFNAAVTLKNGMLIIFKKGLAKTVNGKYIPTTTITRKLGDQHRFAIADRNAYTGVKAYWIDYRQQQKQQTKATRKTKNKNNQTNKDENGVLVGADGNVKILRHTYASKQNAYRAARNEWYKLQRGASQFSINLAEGRPDIYPEMPASVEGFKKEIDSTLWTITRCTHSLDTNSGYTTYVELEIKLEDDEKPKEEQEK